jgi:hypothetical protein
MCSGCEVPGTGGSDKTTNITIQGDGAVTVDSSGNEINVNSQNESTESKGAFIPTAEEDYAIHNPKAGL